MVHLVMLVIFHVNWLLVKIWIYHTFITSLLKKLNFCNANFQIIYMVSNMVQTMWNDMGQYTFNFHKD